MSPSSSEKQRRRELKGRLKSTRNKLVEMGESGENGIQGNRDNEEWGNSMGNKKTNIIRLGFQNIGPQAANKNELRALQTTNYINNNNYEIFLFVEHGLNLKKIKPEHQWNERMTRKGRNYSLLSYNKNDANTASAQLYGGTGISLMGEILHKRHQQGHDPSSLGRWSWIRLRGRRDQFTLLISTYRPVKNIGDIGLVWLQHLRYLRSKNDSRNPHQAYDEDFMEMLQHWITLGDHIIIGGDCNQDVRTGSWAMMLREHHITEAIIQHHKT